jgi:hypothetical protein
MQMSSLRAKLITTPCAQKYHQNQRIELGSNLDIVQVKERRVYCEKLDYLAPKTSRAPNSMDVKLAIIWKIIVYDKRDLKMETMHGQA